MRLKPVQRLFVVIVFLFIAAVSSAQTGQAVVRSSAVIRARPTATAESVATLPAGAAVTVVRVEGSWAFVRTSAGQEGYVARLFLDEPTSAAPAAAPATPPAASTPPPVSTPPVSQPAEPEPDTQSRVSSSGGGGSGAEFQGFVDLGFFKPRDKDVRDGFEALFGKSQIRTLGFGGGVGIGSLFAEVAIRRGTLKPVEDVPVKLVFQPLTITAGFRARSGAARPYVGGGISKYTLKVKSDVAGFEGEDSTSFTGFHVLGGLQYLVSSSLAIGGEAEFSSVKDNPGEGFEKTQAGGLSFRVRVAFGSFKR